MGNHIPLLAEPADMYGKVMSLPDKAMGVFFRLVTRYTPAQIAAIEADLASGQLHPRDAKMQLAFEIASIYHGDAAAREAQEAFIRVFQQGDMPAEMPEYHLQAGDTLLQVMRAAQLVSSNSEGRRLLEQGGVSLDGEKLTDPQAAFPGPGVLRVGRRKFLRVLASA